MQSGVTAMPGRQDGERHDQTGFGSEVSTEALEGARPQIQNSPQNLHDTMDFIFETPRVIRPTKYALASPRLQQDDAD